MRFVEVVGKSAYEPHFSLSFTLTIELALKRLDFSCTENDQTEADLVRGLRSIAQVFVRATFASLWSFRCEDIHGHLSGFCVSQETNPVTEATSKLPRLLVTTYERGLI